MTLKNYMILNAVLFLPFGVVMLAVPALLFPLFGIDLDADGLLMARVVGSSLFTIGLISYLARLENAASTAMKAILIGSFLFHLIDATTTFIGAFTGVMNSLGWMFSSMHFLLAIGFLLYLQPVRKMSSSNA